MIYQNLPQDKFNTVVIDPPWQQTMAVGAYSDPRHSRPSVLPYHTLSLEDIKTFPLGSIANTGSHIYTWTTNKFLRQAFEVLDAWGVRFHLCMPLVKKSGIAPCCGYVFGSEFCLLGFFGQPMQKFTSMGKLNWLLTNPIPGKHSAKPEEFYQLLETMSPGLYCDIFARKQREGWVTWGDELPTTSQD
jgi:N6-adenosine-specific RNA methylase IME4